MMKNKKRGLTGIRLESRISEKDSEKWSGIWKLAPVFYMVLGAYGFMRTMLMLAHPSFEQKYLYGCLFLFGAWFGFIYFARRWRMILAVATISAFGLFFWRQIEAVWTGMEAVLEMALNAQDFGYAASVDMRAETTLALVCVLFVLYCLFFWSMCIESGRYLIILWMLVPVCLAFALYKIPDGVGVFCMIFASAGLNVANPEERSALRGAAALLMGLIGVFALLIGNLAVRPALAPWFEGKEAIRERVQKTSLIQELQDFAKKWQREEETVTAFGGANEGYINTSDFFKETGETLFTVSQTGAPEGSLYLKVYTGSEYTQNQWKSNEDTEPALASFYEYARVLAGQNGYGDARRLLVSVEEAQEEAPYAYAPYFSDYMGTQEDGLHYEYYPASWLGSPFDLESNESAYAYREYVYAHYLDYPAAKLPRMQAYCEEHPLSDVPDICAAVREYLSENATYNEQTGRFPEEVDFAEYFLYEQREGYCVHFATAAVLLMRMYGVPARYVTGYAVPADAFEERDGGWEAEVKDGYAHAWAEIYVDSLGWIPFETTPSYDAGFRESSPEEQMETEQVQEQQTEAQQTEIRQTESQRLETREGLPGNESWGRQELDGAVAAVARAVSVAAVLLALAVVLLFLRREMVLRKRGRKSAKEIFYDLYKVLLFGGMPESVDCMEKEFTQKVTEQFVWIEKEELDLVMDIVMRANYAGEEITREETFRVREMYRYICRMLLRGMRIKQKLLFRFVYVYM